MQSHIYTRWTRLLCDWTSGFGAALYGCAPGLPDQDAHQWGSQSGCSFTQGPEERDRPGPTWHQSHRTGHRRSMSSLVVLERHLWLTMTEMKEVDKVPFLDAPVSSGSLFGPAVEGFAEHFTEAQKSSQAMHTSSRNAPALLLLPVALNLRWLSRKLSQC